MAVQILEKPLLLKAGEIGFHMVKGAKLLIQIVSDDGKDVVYTFPLKSDNVQHTAAKSEVYLPLGGLGSYFKYA
jgi:hypothetical protein